MSLRVLVTDPIIARFADVLTDGAGSGHAWTIAADWPDERVRDAVAESDVVVCSRLPAEVAETCTQPRLVQVSGAGYDRIAVDSLPGHVAVANTYHHGRPIAEHVLMVSMMLSRHVLRADGELRGGIWRSIANDETAPFGTTLDGRVLGLVGLGEIGSHVARLAAAFDMRVRAVRGSPDAPYPEGVEWVGGPGRLLDLAAESDVLVVTTPLSEHTRGLVDARVLDAMPDSGLLVNVARGPVVDEEALYDALVRGSIAGAGIDVWWEGSGTGTPSRLPYTNLPNVVVTPHQSGHTLATFESRAHDIAANVAAAADGRPLRNLVRPPTPTPR